MSDMTVKTPWHLWAVGAVALLWNSYGGYDYVMTQTNNAAYLAHFTAEQRAYFDSFPLWMEAVWAIGVWGGLLGGILGVLLGWLVSRLANWIANLWTLRQGGGGEIEFFYLTPWLIAGSILFAVAVSLAAGYYPATRAARINPVEALRHD